MDKNLNKLGFIGLGVAIIGLFLSFLLILEYYGSAGTVGDKLCGAIGDANSCQEVAESSYSAIRGVPLFGDIPVALIGFAFYGALSFGFFKLGSSKTSEEYRSILNLLLPFTILGIAADFILLLISLFLIGKVCSMCLMTYVVTISLFVIAFVGSKKTLEVKGDSPLEGLKKNVLNYAIAFFAFFAIGLVTARSISAGPESIGDSNTTNLNFAAYESQKVNEFNTNGVSMRGKKDAPITIVEFADYNCGHCMHASHILDQVVREFDGMVKVYYMNFPLDGNCNRLVQRQQPGASSCVAAISALCGDEQGKFTEVHHGLYKDNENGVMHSTTSVLNVASKTGVNMNQFRQCMNSQKILKQINQEVDEAEKVNIQSTPSLFINGKALQPGTPDPVYLRKLLKYLVDKA
ncbi:MAG: thioredoxin domain-containing protein [Leptospira sp.]|nr:thioredoxin domain-containing protein [Leptospira sp.]